MSDVLPAGPVVMITGANRGIGLAIAQLLRQHGYRLSLGARRPKTLCTALGDEDDSMMFHRFDAVDAPVATDWVSSTAARFGGIDALVNCAGISDSVTITEDNDALLDLLWAVNVKAPLRLTRLCLPYLEATGTGRIVNISSLSGKRVCTPNVGYAMTKFALMALTHTTRFIAYDKGVRATAICPSTVKTDMGARVNVDPALLMSPDTVAQLVRTAIELPNNAAIAEMLVNIRREDLF